MDTLDLQKTKSRKRNHKTKTSTLIYYFTNSYFIWVFIDIYIDIEQVNSKNVNMIMKLKSNL